MFDSDICFSKTTGKPLKSYESENEAEEAIEYVKATYGNEQVKYLCQKCGFCIYLQKTDKHQIIKVLALTLTANQNKRIQHVKLHFAELK